MKFGALKCANPNYQLYFHVCVRGGGGLETDQGHEGCPFCTELPQSYRAIYV